MEQSTELKNFTLRVYEALEKADHSFFERYLSSEDGTLVIGTDPNEWWPGKAMAIKLLKAQLEETGGFPITADAPQAYSQGDIGWMADRPRLKLPDGAEMPLRLTLVFHKENGDWKIVQWHVSIGVSNEEALGQELTTE